MKNLIRAFSLFLALTLGLVAAAPAFARDGGDQGNLEDSVKAAIQTGLSGHEQDGEDWSASSSASTSVGVGGRGEGEMHASVQGREGMEAAENEGPDNDNEQVEVDRGHMGTTTEDVQRPEDVQNFGQLRSFAAHVINEDRHVSRVALSSTTVQAHVDAPASFLGVLPTSVQAQVSVNSDGSVDVHYPWYAFFFKTNQDQVKTQVTNAVNQVLASSTLDAQTQATLSAKLQATILQSIVSSLKSLFQ